MSLANDTMTSALTARSPDILTPPDQPSEAGSPSGRN